MMFDAISNYIIFLEQCLSQASDPREIQEIQRILITARKVEMKFRKVHLKRA